MKIRIQDSSIRYRLTIREVEQLAASGELTAQTLVPAAAGGAMVFRYGVVIDEALAESEVRLGPAAITMALSRADAATLLEPTQEGVYVRRQWTGSDGSPKRFIAFVEKDRPGSTCIKPEAWIYEAPPGGTVSTVPIPPKVDPIR